ncbi:MAG: cell division protein FtsK [Acidobacteria bacterium]|nr:MAG: cell division protein FtsK [Acidobacteriota bacterium]
MIGWLRDLIEGHRESMSWRGLREPRLGEMAGVLLLAAGALLAVSLLTYHPDDPSWWVERTGKPLNWIGPVGANISRGAFESLGFAAIALPLALMIFSWALLRGSRSPAPSRGAEPAWARAVGLIVVLLAFAVLLSAFFPGEMEFRGDTMAAGGLIGAAIARLAEEQVGWFGAIIGAACGIALGLIFSTRFSFAVVGALTARPMRHLSQSLRVRWARFREARRKEKMRRAVLRKHLREQRRRQKQELRRERDGEAEQADGLRSASSRSAASHAGGAPRPSSRASLPGSPDEEGKRMQADGSGRSGQSPRAGEGAGTPVLPRRAPGPAQPPLPLSPHPPPAGSFSLPSIDLLAPPPAESPVNERELIERARLMSDKLREFAVEGQVVQIHPGPVVTTYEFKPEPGVKYSRILSLVDDLCLALKAESIRVDRVAGKSTVGVEVPNVLKETIHLRDVIGSTAFAASRSRLTLALGKTIDGEPYVTDLEPHLLIPVVTDMKKAAAALKWAVREMEIRYRTLATTGVRNIEQFNTLLRHEPNRTRRNEKTGAEEPLRPLPYIVVVIDELADLMMVASVEVEESITRLAQMARAVGIHLVLATQRPSVDVITGIIKANFPARIAFRVSQKVDSRTILDTGGAEALLGSGDLLFLPPGSSRLIRVHGALVTEPETCRIVDFLKKQATPSYNTSVLQDAEEEEADSHDAERDEMYRQAVRLVVTTGQASVSHLQRRLRLGYARAARIVDMMEDEGIVGPGEGAKPREVLVGPEFLERLGQIAEEGG